MTPKPFSPPLGLYKRKSSCDNLDVTSFAVKGDLWLLIETERAINTGVNCKFLLPNGLIRHKFWTMNIGTFYELFEKV
jgi:hypothetical protein